jgi:diguanylate cyclase (GGDEF)-like protein
VEDKIVAEAEQRAARDRVILREAAALFAAELSLDALFERVALMLAKAVDASVVFISLAEPDGRLMMQYLYDHGQIRTGIAQEAHERSRSLEVFRTGKVIWGNDPSRWASTGRVPINLDRPWTDDTVSAIFVPMRTAGSNVGVLSVQSTRPDAYDEDEVELVAAIGHYLAIAVENQRLYETLRRTADTDPLTELATHSKVVRVLDEALAGATNEAPAALVLFNVMNFASFNDLYGHVEGDAVLRRVAAAIRESAGGSALVGRFGGDVFAAILRGRSRDATEAFVERASLALRRLSYDGNAGSIPIAVACGYAFAPADAASRSELIAVCVHRARLSRKYGGVPLGTDDIDAYAVHGRFDGLETIVESLLDRDPFMRVHLVHVNAMAKHWADYNLRLSPAELERFLQASLLHDVGKLLVSDRILVKPGRLTHVEYVAAQQHAEFGRTIIASQPGYEEVAEIVGQHHERWDGCGYPRGLAGEAIHPLARVVSVLDAYSAMTLDRPYHRGIGEAEALAEIERCSGTQFDPGAVALFLEWRRALSGLPAGRER